MNNNGKSNIAGDKIVMKNCTKWYRKYKIVNTIPIMLAPMSIKIPGNLFICFNACIANAVTKLKTRRPWTTVLILRPITSAKTSFTTKRSGMMQLSRMMRAAMSIAFDCRATKNSVYWESKLKIGWLNAKLNKTNMCRALRASEGGLKFSSGLVFILFFLSCR